jgi:hypothetical protein
MAELKAFRCYLVAQYLANTLQHIMTPVPQGLDSATLFYALNYWGVHPAARVSSNVNKPPYATMFGARFYCALTLHVWPRSVAIFTALALYM